MTLYLIIATTLLSLICFYNQEINHKLILNPYQVKHQNEWYRMLTSGFMHADFMHLFVNMFVLYSFGRMVEFYYSSVFGEAGQWVYLLLYISAIVAANASTQFKHQNSSYYNSLGASGAVSAVLFTSILFAPFNKVYIYGIIEMPGIVMGLLYLGYSYYMAKKQTDNTNHEAHFYGAVYGILFTVVLKPEIVKFFLSQF